MKLADKFSALIVAILLAISSVGAAPFEVGAFLRPSGVYAGLLVVTARIPEGHLIYADEFKVATIPPLALAKIAGPEPVTRFSGIDQAERTFYTNDFTAVYALEQLPSTDSLRVTVSYLGCNDFICFTPRTMEFALDTGHLPVPAEPPDPVVLQSAELDSVSPSVIAEPQEDWRELLQRFEVRAMRSGYMRPDDFLDFLDFDGKPPADETDSVGYAGGIWWWALLILAGGVALNLTPCVLPMIPVNLAVIGAVTTGRPGSRNAGVGGADKPRRRRGFWLGCMYGAGITAAYGGLGVLVMLTGAFFGGINATPWFNFSIAVLFLLMALAMFDVFMIDFSRWQSRLAVARGGWLAPFIMGALAALLAGACVAPVVITVLTQALVFYSGGRPLAGLMLPFLLGAGMALPWPLAGAGLAALPRPGRWMNWVKRAFGILILLLAFYYARQGVELLPGRAERAAQQHAQSAAAKGWLTSLPEALALAEQADRPLLIDFWATWCKNCMAMDATTLRHPEVTQRMQDFVQLKYQAERPDEMPVREVLEEFNVIGLPTFVILVKSKD